MYNVDYKNVKKGIYFGLFFVIIGIVFLAIFGGITFYNDFRKMSMDSSIKAETINENCNYNREDNYVCSPSYIYYVDGKEYTCKVNNPSTKRFSNSDNLVYYDSKNPSNCVTDYELKKQFHMYLLCFIPFMFIVAGILNIKKVIKKINRIKYLSKHGNLVKGLEYRLEPTGIVVMNVRIMAPVIDYTLPNGETVHLVGDPRYDKKNGNYDGLVDLLIDPNDPSNYFIDFNIDKI